MSVRDMLRVLDADDRFFAAHIMDLCESAASGKFGASTGFCDLHQAQLTKQIAAASGITAEAVGGSEEAERVLFLLYDEPWMRPDPPLCAIEITAYGAITHRDILGAVLALGIKREMVGDIWNAGSSFVLMAKSPAENIILNNLDRVGREAVKCKQLDLAQIPPPVRQFSCRSGTVKSLRLDSVVSLCAGVSREKGKELVEREKVMVDAVLRKDPSFPLAEEFTVSIRGVGKFRLKAGGVSGKGRYILEIKKYI